MALGLSIQTSLLSNTSYFKYGYSLVGIVTVIGFTVRILFGDAVVAGNV